MRNCKSPLIFLAALALSQVYACRTMFIYSEHDSSIPFNRSDLKIGVYIDQNASMSDRNIGTIIRNEMSASGFHIVEPQDADYLLSFNTIENTTKINSAIILPSTTTTTGNVGGIYYSGTSTSTQAIPYNYDYTVRRVWFYLFSRESILASKPQTVWEGYIGVDTKDFEKDPKQIVHKFLEYFEKHQKDHVPF